MKKREEIKSGVKAGIPIVIGYIPIAIAFGMLSKTVGISLIHSIMFSSIVYAGASQFMALSLLSMGVGVGEIIITTLLVNFRHFLMSAATAVRLKDEIKGVTPIVAFGVTDEVFSVASMKEGKLSKEFMLALQLVSYLSWNIGTILGYLLGNVLPPIVGSGMQIALYSMFAAILIPEVKKSTRILVLAALSGIVHMILSYVQILPKGWNMIAAIVLISFVGAISAKGEEVEANE